MVRTQTGQAQPPWVPQAHRRWDLPRAQTVPPGGGFQALGPDARARGPSRTFRFPPRPQSPPAFLPRMCPGDASRPALQPPAPASWTVTLHEPPLPAPCELPTSGPDLKSSAACTCSPPGGAQPGVHGGRPTDCAGLWILPEWQCEGRNHFLFVVAPVFWAVKTHRQAGGRVFSPLATKQAPLLRVVGKLEPLLAQGFHPHRDNRPVRGGSILMSSLDLDQLCEDLSFVCKVMPRYLGLRLQHLNLRGHSVTPHTLQRL
ncbi:hypothetical protein CapIbe_023306 [Capra ibex]